VVLSTPPLRDHHDDIALLVEHFTEQYCKEYNRRPKTWSAAAIRQMKAHGWPGNVRELKNVVERAVIMELDDTIDHAVVVDGPGSDDVMAGLLDAPTLAEFQRASEIAYLRRQLERNRWNIAATARAIGTPRSNLYKKLQAYGIEREDT
jgi:DNA-binding NtrC family response regulator